MPGRGLPVIASTTRTDLGGTMRTNSRAYKAPTAQTSPSKVKPIYFGQRLRALAFAMRPLHTKTETASRLRKIGVGGLPERKEGREHFAVGIHKPVKLARWQVEFPG